MDDNVPIAEINIYFPYTHVCILCASLDARWEYTAKLAGPITLAGGNDRLAVTIPAKVDANFGFHGDLARIFAFDKKNATAAAEISFASALRADSRFCPALVDTTLGYRWLQGPEIEIIGKNSVFGACIGPWRYNFATYLDPVIRDAMPGAVAELQKWHCVRAGADGTAEDLAQLLVSGRPAIRRAHVPQYQAPGPVLPRPRRDRARPGAGRAFRCAGVA